MLELIQKGGIVMYPLVLCSVVALSIVIEKIYNLSRASVDSEKLMEKIKEKIERKDFSQAIAICEATPGPVARVLAVTIKLRDLSDDKVKEGIKEAVFGEIPRMEKFLPTLSTIVTISPLLGLLGTISGLMKLFGVIAKGGIGDAQALSSGIAEALITTATGLTIAIVFLIFHNILATKVDSIINDIEKRVAELLNFLKIGEI